jgi:hypothetical protein
MALLVSNRFFLPGAVNAAAHTVPYTFGGRFSGASANTTTDTSFEYGFSAEAFLFSAIDGSFFDQDTADFSAAVVLVCDRAYKFRAHAVNALMAESPFAAQTNFQTYAIASTSSVPVISGISQTGAAIACNFFPNTDESIVVAILQYRVFGSGAAWTSIATTAGATSGYTQTTATGVLTGLTCGVTYEVRLVLSRTTVNDQNLVSASGTFTSGACSPFVQTVPYSNLHAHGATIHGLVNPNGYSCRVRFGFGTLDAGSGSWGQHTAYQYFSGTTNQAFSDVIAGVNPNRTQHYRALCEYPDPTFASLVQGETLEFHTPFQPLVQALDEDHMHIYQYDGKYGVASAFYFTLSAPADTNSDRLVNTAPASLFVVGDIKVSKDGGAFSNVPIASITQVAASYPLYFVTLSITEMQGTQIAVLIVDQDGPAFRDAMIFIRTRVQLSQIDLDPTGIGGNTSGFLIAGVGTSPAVLATGGAISSGDITGANTSQILHRGTAAAGGGSTITLDSAAIASDDYYNGSVVSIVGGTGIGQSRVIIDYVAATRIATVNRAWSTAPAAGTNFVITEGQEVWSQKATGELATLPTSGSTYGEFIQFLFQRFAYYRTQTASHFDMYKADGTTLIAGGTVSDDGLIQKAHKLS